MLTQIWNVSVKRFEPAFNVVLICLAMVFAGNARSCMRLANNVFADGIRRECYAVGAMLLVVR